MNIFWRLTSFLVLFLKLHELWKRSDDCLTGREEIDAIVPVSYTTGLDNLADATRENLLKAVRLTRYYPHAALMFSNCSYVFSGAEVREKELKKEILEGLGCTHFMSADKMDNSVEEAWAIKKLMPFARGIIVVTGEDHARSAHFIWKRVFPGARVYIVTIPYTFETQPDHPVPDQRSSGKWFIMNLLRHASLVFFGLKFTAEVKHRAAP